MKARVVGAVVLTLVVGVAGVAGGWALARENTPEPEQRATFADPAPLPADPSLPVQRVEPDPDDPALEAGIALRQETLVALNDKGKPSDLRVTLPVPVGWSRADIPPAQWNYTKPGNTSVSFGLRVEIIADRGMTVENATRGRQSELRSSQAQGNIADLDFEQESSGGYVATFLDGGFRRVDMERFFSGPDPNLAFLTVAVYGREVDRAGLTDLLERISSDFRVSQTP